MNMLIHVVSLVGAILILAAYVALQRRWWASHASGYLWCNLVGATLLTIVALWDHRAGFVVLELAWAMISFRSLIRGRARPPRRAARLTDVRL